MKSAPAHLQQYVDYIRNTGQVPLDEIVFDEDWEPIGPAVRKEMHKLGLIEQYGGALALELDVA